jgi:hypothetical protein
MIGNLVVYSLRDDRTFFYVWSVNCNVSFQTRSVFIVIGKRKELNYVTNDYDINICITDGKSMGWINSLWVDVLC